MRHEQLMETIRISVEPGICGFCCQVQARQQNKKRAAIEITGSQCKLVQKLADSVKEVTLHDIFTGHCSNPVFKAASQAGCHLSCPVPVAILKAAEVALGLALPQEVRISFGQCEKKGRP